MTVKTRLVTAVALAGIFVTILGLWNQWSTVHIDSGYHGDVCNGKWKEFMSRHLQDVELELKAQDAIKKETIRRYQVKKNKCLPGKIVAKLPEDLSSRIKLFEPNMTLAQINNHKILIATPAKSANDSGERYFRLINSIDYPHRLISVAVGVDPSSVDTYKSFKESSKLATGFNGIRIIMLKKKSYDIGSSWTEKHREEVQEARRRSLALARNELLYRSLTDEFDYVLWVDSDVKSWPNDVIQHLISAKQDVVAPSCMFKSPRGNLSLYDRNSWQETQKSLEYLSNLPAGRLVLEGYGTTKRLYITDLRQNKRVVDLDGVGGCVLLVRAACHRIGLSFPSIIFDHHIETEGLAKLALKMGLSVCGLPYLEVIHS